MIAEALRGLAPAPEVADAEYAARFRALAELLLARARLVIAGEPHRFTEIELYVRGFQHVDPFTHGDPLQQELGRWYFHRIGGTYRGGTYKGVDIAFGQGGAYAGILIRGLATASDVLVDGPSLVVDHILARTKSTSIAELVQRGDAIDAAALHIAPVEGSAAIYATPRVGLSLAREGEARRHYLARPYRFLSEPARIKKGKPHLVTALHREGRAIGDIAAMTAMRPSVVERYVAAYERGRTTRDAATTDVCALLGACSDM